MSSVVLDSSALLAVLHHEPGEAVVLTAIAEGAAMSAVNLSEVISKLAEGGMSREDAQDTLEPYSLDVLAFSQHSAMASGLLRPSTRGLGLSLGDRACVALGRELGLPVLTGDRRWSNLDRALGVEVRLIR